MKFFLLALAFSPAVLASPLKELAEADQYDLDFAEAMKIYQETLDNQYSIGDIFGHGGEKVCYGDLGCFDNSIEGALPAKPETIRPEYTLCAQDKANVNLSWDESVEQMKLKTKDHFADEKPLIFIAHGFGESAQSSWMWDLKNASLKAYPDANVIVVDWNLGAAFPYYYVAAANVPLIANMTVRLALTLIEASPSIKAKNIYFIGFSLGAQMSGFFARSFTKQTGEKIGRITSCDAAAPGFQDKGMAPNKGDADVIEAIHTSAGSNFFLGQVGFIEPYADIDFYPNGGVYQPGCSVFQASCAHKRSVLYLTQALNDLSSCQLKGVGCSNFTEANNSNCNGPEVDAYVGMLNIAEFVRANNNYEVVYVTTSSTVPYCKSSEVRK